MNILELEIAAAEGSLEREGWFWTGENWQFVSLDGQTTAEVIHGKYGIDGEWESPHGQITQLHGEYDGTPTDMIPGERVLPAMLATEAALRDLDVLF